MLQSLCKQTCLALLDNTCVFYLQINFWVSHRGYEGFRGTHISFSTIFYPILAQKMYNARDFSSFYKYIIPYKTFYSFWEQCNLLCVILKTNEKGLQWKTEPEILFITQNSLYRRRRRKPIGKRKGHREWHIFSIYPAIVQKLRNLP